MVTIPGGWLRSMFPPMWWSSSTPSARARRLNQLASAATRTALLGPSIGATTLCFFRMSFTRLRLASFCAIFRCDAASWAFNWAS